MTASGPWMLGHDARDVRHAPSSLQGRAVVVRQSRGTWRRAARWDGCGRPLPSGLMTSTRRRGSPSVCAARKAAVRLPLAGAAQRIGLRVVGDERLRFRQAFGDRARDAGEVVDLVCVEPHAQPGLR